MTKSRIHLPVDPLRAAVILFIALRVVHRLYYMRAGHEHFWLLSAYKPKNAFEAFLKTHVTVATEHSFAAKRVSG